MIFLLTSASAVRRLGRTPGFVILFCSTGANKCALHQVPVRANDQAAVFPAKRLGAPAKERSRVCKYRTRHQISGSV